jgi:ABC-type uncharacterized transport system permease subunit
LGRSVDIRALAALAGFVISSGSEGRLTQGFFEGYGFSGVLIAFLARNNAVLAAIVAFLIAMLFVTGQSLQIFYQIPFAMVQMIQAIIVMCVAGFGILHSPPRAFPTLRPAMQSVLLSWLANSPALAVPYALAALGLIIGERSGVLSLGAEGLMLVGALAE